MDMQCTHEGGDAHDQRDVGDVRADDITNGDAARALHVGEDRDDEFGQRGAQCDDRKTHDQGRDAVAARDVNGGINRPISAANEQQDASNDRAKGEDEEMRLG